MPLIGDFSTMSLPDLLQWLAISQKTGILLLQREEIVKEIYFRDGRIISSASNDPREYFGQFLLAYGKLEESQLLDAFAEQARTGVKLGRILVVSGYLDEDEVQRFLRIKAEETIYDLFLWENGEFKFYTDVPAQGNHVPISMDVTSILMEGSRRSDEWRRIREAFPTGGTVIGIAPDSLTREILADPLYNRMVQLLESPKRISDLCLMFHASDFAVHKTLFDMYRMGVIQVLESGEPEEVRRIPKDRQIRELANQGLKQFNQMDYEASIQTFKAALDIDPTHALARAMIQKAYKEIKQDLVTDEFSIEHVPFLKRSLSELHEQEFTPQENYILSRIDGTNAVQNIIRLSPIQEIKALLIFKRLAKDALIGFLPPPASPAN